ncbi:Hypothetical_protein [Hexamita inflata]|uniref:Hypothetical_protein n=1 Tax=Hexamita inflata TaxID=28002 RepID=A0AA86R9A7_9EUKA|nr:Hypothetical protein HINF_LOCUS56243 [Hexamita inflata]
MFSGVLLLLQTYLKWAKQSSIRYEDRLRQLKVMFSSMDLNKYATQIIIASTYPFVQGRTGCFCQDDCFTGDVVYLFPSPQTIPQQTNQQQCSFLCVLTFCIYHLSYLFHIVQQACLNEKTRKWGFQDYYKIILY